MATAIDFYVADIRGTCTSRVDQYLRAIGDGIFVNGRLIHQVRYTTAGDWHASIAQVYEFDHIWTRYALIVFQIPMYNADSSVYPARRPPGVIDEVLVIPAGCDLVSTKLMGPPKYAYALHEHARAQIVEAVRQARFEHTRESAFAKLKGLAASGELARRPCGVSIITEARYLVGDMRDDLLAAQPAGYFDAPNHVEVLFGGDARTGIFRSGVLLETKATGENADLVLYQQYKFPNYYVVLQNYVGSCAGCSGVKLDKVITMIEANVRRAYVSPDPVDLKTYIKGACRDFKDFDTDSYIADSDDGDAAPASTS